jgi:hypothetical protein
MKESEFWYVDQNMDIDEYYDCVPDSDSVCYECGCPDVEEKRISWHKVNGGEIMSDGEYESDYWCPYCEDHLSIIEMKEWKKENEEKFFIKKGEK